MSEMNLGTWSSHWSASLSIDKRELESTILGRLHFTSGQSGDFNVGGCCCGGHATSRLILGMSVDYSQKGIGRARTRPTT